MIAIITDVAANFLNKELPKNVYLVAQKAFTINDLQVGKDIDADEFYVNIKKAGPGTTAAPTVEEFLNVYEQVIKDGYDKVVVTVMGSNLSSTYNNAVVASKEYENNDNLEILVYDTNGVVLAEQGYVVDFLNNNYQTLEEVKKNFDRINNKLIFCLNDISALKKGGRISPTQAMAASLLGIKPIIYLNNGKLELFDKARTEKKALDIMLNYIQNSPTNNIVHIGVLGLYSKMFDLAIEKVNQIYNQEITKLNFLDPVVGNHTSSPLFGIGISWKED